MTLLFKKTRVILASTIALCLFGALPLWGQPAVKLLYTDWTLNPGSLMHQGSAGEQTLYQHNNRMYAATLDPGGQLYYSNFNDSKLYRWTGEERVEVFNHTTYLRCVRFDPSGNLYFSESSGASSDGKIYKLVNGTAQLYYTVKLTQVGGFWAGWFAFDSQGVLHLSSGNRSPAEIYRVISNLPNVIHQASNPITGFSFDDSNNIYYASWSDRIYKLTQGGVRTTALLVPGRRFADALAVQRGFSTGPNQGRVNVVRVVEGTDTLYAANSTGSIMRSLDGGDTWQWHGKGITDPNLGGLLVYPPNPDILMTCAPSGVFRSVDRGETWSQTLSFTKPMPPPADNLWVNHMQKSPMLYDPLNQLVYAAPATQGLWVSSDGGINWNQVYSQSNSLSNRVFSLSFSPSNGGTVYFTTGAGLRQIVAGGPETIVSTGIPEHPIMVRVAPSNPDTIYLTAFNLFTSPYKPWVWKRSTAMGSWTKTTVMPPWTDHFLPSALGIDPNNSDNLYVGNVRLFKSNDGGATLPSSPCNSVIEICRADWHDIHYDTAGNRIFGTHDHGIMRFDRNTNTYEQAETGLTNTQFYEVDISSTGILYGGTQDTGGYKRVPLNEWSSFSAASGDVLSVVVDPTDDQHILFRTNNFVVKKSIDGGASFTISNEFPHQGFWGNVLAYDPGSNTVYSGTKKGVYKSTDDGVTFVPSNSGMGEMEVRSLDVSPTDVNLLYAGSFSNGLWKSVNGALDWFKLGAFPENNALVIRVGANGHIYVGTTNGVYVSTNGGQNWTARSNGLPANAVVSEIQVDPACPCRLYAGLGYYGKSWVYEGGVYESLDGGISWNRISGERETPIAVTSIRIDPVDAGTLHVGTYGSGVFTLFRDLQGGCPCP